MAKLVASGDEIERAAGGQAIARHHHQTAYAALVLKGGYIEAGDRGRHAACAGNVLYHAAFEGHANTIGSAGAQILNVPLERVPDYAFGRCRDPDGVAALAQLDIDAASQLLLQTSGPEPHSAMDWPDLLAVWLTRDRETQIRDWAAAHGLEPCVVSRGFRLCFGVSPKRFRLECRAAAAARAIQGGMGLADASFTTGFCDQQHMTRSVNAVLGRTPGRLRN